MDIQENLQDFLKDFSIMIPVLHDYEVMDWMILCLWTYSVLCPMKNRGRALILASLIEFLWGIYAISICEFAQSIPFFFYSLVTATTCMKVFQDDLKVKKKSINSENG